MSAVDHVKILDTTLRDGEQSPGASMDVAGKVQIARALVRLNVDVIEAGFPISSPDDFNGVVAVANEVGDRAIVSALSRCNQTDIQRAADALKSAAHPRIHVFLATSAIHRQFKLKLTKDEILGRARDGVRFARSFVSDVEFSPEDAARTEPEFLIEVLRAAVEAGATTLNIPDTVGYAIPGQYGLVIAAVRREFPENVVISTHCHNDLDLANANSLAGVENGARQIECTIAGIGERAGNAHLASIVMALKLRYPHLFTRVRTQELGPAVETLRQVTGLKFSRSLAVVGKNAFAHEAGIHQHGVLEEPKTYEIMRPADVGWTHSRMVLGKHSGKAAVADALRNVGIVPSDDEVGQLVSWMKSLPPGKKEVYVSDFVAVLGTLRGQPQGDVWSLDDFRLFEHARGAKVHRASVGLRSPDGSLKIEEGEGDGSMDALFAAILKIVGLGGTKLEDYVIRNVSTGEDSLAEASVRLSRGGISRHAIAVETDSIEAAVRAYLTAVNEIILAMNASAAA